MTHHKVQSLSSLVLLESYPLFNRGNPTICRVELFVKDFCLELVILKVFDVFCVLLSKNVKFIQSISIFVDLKHQVLMRFPDLLRHGFNLVDLVVLLDKLHENILPVHVLHLNDTLLVCLEITIHCLMLGLQVFKLGIIYIHLAFPSLHIVLDLFYLRVHLL
jgi:hypothetical protein